MQSDPASPSEVERAGAPPSSEAKRPAPSEDEGEHPFNPFALVILVVLIAGGLWLVFTLKDMAAVQDCAWSGRRNCAPIAPEAPVPLSK